MLHVVTYGSLRTKFHHDFPQILLISVRVVIWNRLQPNSLNFSTLSMHNVAWRLWR